MLGHWIKLFKKFISVKDSTIIKFDLEEWINEFLVMTKTFYNKICLKKNYRKSSW